MASAPSKFGPGRVGLSLLIQVASFVLIALLFSVGAALVHIWAFHKGWATTSASLHWTNLAQAALVGLVCGIASFLHFYHQAKQRRAKTKAVRPSGKQSHRPSR